MAPVTEVACMDLVPPTKATDPGLRDVWTDAQQKFSAASGVEYNLWQDIQPSSSNCIYMVGGWKDHEVQATFRREQGPALLKPFAPYVARRYAHHIHLDTASVPRDAPLLLVTICTVQEDQAESFETKVTHVHKTLTEAGKSPYPVVGAFAHSPNSEDPPAKIWVTYSGCDTEEDGSKFVDRFNALVAEGGPAGLKSSQTLYLRKYL